MTQLETKIIANTWVKGTWEDYLQVTAILEQRQSYYKGYYYQNCYKLEMTPIGFNHGCDHTIIMYVVNLYSTIKQIDFLGVNGCSYRKVGCKEVQPDGSYYFGAKADLIPYDTSIVDLDKYPAPDLVIEVSKTTLGDDLGNKRLLYEELGVSEYWVVDVENSQVIAFKIVDKGSQRLEVSQVLPGLKITLLNEALRRSRETNHSRVGQWLMQQWNNEQ